MQLLLLFTLVFLNLSIIFSFSSLETSNRRLSTYLFFRSIELWINSFFVKFAIDFLRLQKNIDNRKFIRILFQNSLYRRRLTTIRRQAIRARQIDFTFVCFVFLVSRQLLIYLLFRRRQYNQSLFYSFRKTFSISILRLIILTIFYLIIIHAILLSYLIDKKRILSSNNKIYYKFLLIRCK